MFAWRGAGRAFSNGLALNVASAIQVIQLQRGSLLCFV